MTATDDVIELAEDSQLRPAEQVRLAYDPDPWVRMVLADNHGLTAEAQYLLARDEDLSVVLRLAANPRLDPTVQECLFADARRGVLAVLGANPALTGTLMTALALTGLPEHSGPPGGARLELAGNSALQPRAAEVLADDPSTEVRRALAANRQLPAGVARRLADDVALVRGALADNPALPPDAVTNVLKPRDDAGLNPDERSALAQRPFLPESAQHALVTDASATVRRSLAGNPWLLPLCQRQLSVDADVAVREALASNESLSPELQVPLVAAGAEPVDRAVAQRRDILGPALRILLNRVESADDIDLLRSDLLTGAGPLRRRAPDLKHEQRGPVTAATTDRPHVLRRAVASPDPTVRLASVINAAIGAEQLRTLLTDTDADVRAKAALRLLAEVAAV